jgi:RNA recognition motif. (a.k.a. RRM, RBD, or RNP domain)
MIMPDEYLISQFITALNKAELYPDSEELADVLWLALQIDVPVNKKESNINDEETISNQIENKPPLENQKLPEKPPEKLPEKQSTTQTQQQKSSLFPHQQNSGINPSGMKGQAFRTPALSLLHNVLAFNRAFRPLRKTVASRFHTELDIEETVNYIAETQIFSPILKGKPERWLELVILIDNAISMQIWQPLLKEFRRLLELQGTFAKLHFYQLDTEQETARVFNNQRVIKNFEIINPQQPRLILVFSDCVAKAWHSNQGVFALLQQWSRKHPVSIMQMLPFRLWKGTALGYAEEARFTAALPLALNHALNLDRQDFWFVDDISGLEKGFKIPVLTLEPEIVKTWAKLVLGKQDSWLKGVVFDNPAALIPPLETAAEQPAVEITAEQRLKQFKSFASPTAQQLAAYLAAVPLDLSVMNVVQKLMLPQSSQVHLAEVFLGGLLKRVPHHAWLEYEFHAGVRELLLDSVIVADAVFVLTRVSDFVEQRFGQSLDFLALLANPNLTDGIELNESTRPFAEVGAKILKRLGGEYTHLANSLEEGQKTTEFITITKQQALANLAGVLRKIYYLKKSYVAHQKIGRAKLYIGGLSWNLNSEYLKEIFSPYGEVDYAEVVKDKATNRSKGYGFVEFINGLDAAEAKLELDHKEIDGRVITVSFVRASIDITRLPKPTTALINRKAELDQLTEAIKNPNKRLAIIVAAGGIGKSALIDKWLQQIAQENYYGKTHVFGWSFYSQDSHNTFTNSQSFFNAVLLFLGVAEIPKDEIDKARVLARYLQRKPCLLILDGLEPLQYPESLQAISGELQDVALKEFIICFRQIASKSFVLISSRQPLVELEAWHSENYSCIKLEKLSVVFKTDPPHEYRVAFIDRVDCWDNFVTHRIKNESSRKTFAFIVAGVREEWPESFQYRFSMYLNTKPHSLFLNSAGNNPENWVNSFQIELLNFFGMSNENTTNFILTKKLLLEQLSQSANDLFFCSYLNPEVSTNHDYIQAIVSYWETLQLPTASRRHVLLMVYGFVEQGFLNLGARKVEKWRKTLQEKLVIHKHPDVVMPQLHSIRREEVNYWISTELNDSLEQIKFENALERIKGDRISHLMLRNLYLEIASSQYKMQ